jgi:hypothetical protein
MNFKTQILLFSVLISTSVFAQVGIGNTNPQATLEVSASNQASPTNTDGILIPRIDAFPATNPTINQDSMVVYLTTTDGTDTPGFYYWNNNITAWLPLGGGASNSGWELTGNSGTTNGTSFLGTTDSQALDIRTNNVIRARFTTNGKLEILNSGNSVYIGENAGSADPTTADKENVMIGTNAGQNITSGASSAFHGRYNVGVGFRALEAQTTGHRNTAVGHLAGLSITTGRFNTAIGVDALKNATDTDYNTAVGNDALENVNGDRNTALGYRALGGANNPVIGVAQRNTAVGYAAGIRIHDGANNVWVGDDVDQFNTDGVQNTILGSQAGATVGSEREVNGRVLIGYQAARGSNGTDNTLYIENSASVTPLIYGEFDNDILRVGGQLQIGSSDDSSAGSIYGFPTVDGTSGQVLTTDGAGNVTWQNGGGSGADTQDLSIDNTTADLSLVDGGTVEIKTIADSDDDTLIQVEESADEDIIRFDVEGMEHFRMTTTGQLEVLNSGLSVYIGENAGAADPTTVDKQNVMIGTNAGQSITTGAGSAFEGAYSTGVGFSALANQTTGNRNTAVGNNAALNTTTGDFNTAVGQDALKNAVDASYNTALGQDALENVEGDRNTAVGYRALAGANNASVGTGQNNTAVGEGAGRRIQGGNNNVWLGDDVDEFNTDGIQNTIIGSQAGGSLGSPRAINGRVLIGYQAGRSSVGIDNTLYIENSSSTTPLIGGDFANDRLGINKDISTLTHTLEVGGSVKIDTLINLTPGTVPATPAEGDVYYDSATKKIRVWTGAAWENLN